MTAVLVDASPRFPEIEQRVLAFWAQDDTFRASVERNPAGENGANEFVFYDGPPFANGLPHYGHLLTGYVKDIVPRYQTMRGHRVERRFGWDSHGLPAELEAMAQLGLKTKDDILELGIEKFNEACRASVLKYTQEWRDYVTRQARWVDFDHDYKTLDPTFMESVLWAFKTLYDKGLVYEGMRVLPYCWNDETPLSNHELRMDDDVYQMRQDPAVTVGYRLDSGELLLIWTTTPWTLPSNLAIAVGPDLDYVVVEHEGRALRHRRGPARGVRAGARGRTRSTGSSSGSRDPSWSAGRTRRRSPTSSATRTRTACWRPTSSPPTRAPGWCTSRRRSARRTWSSARPPASQPVVPVDARGRFTCEVRDYAGLHVFDANAEIIRDLKAATAGSRSARSARARCCCGTRRTTTPTRTAGAAGTR